MENKLGIIWGMGSAIFILSIIFAIATGGAGQPTISYWIGFLLGSCIIFIKN